MRIGRNGRQEHRHRSMVKVPNTMRAHYYDKYRIVINFSNNICTKHRLDFNKHPLAWNPWSLKNYTRRNAKKIHIKDTQWEQWNAKRNFKKNKNYEKLKIQADHLKVLTNFYEDNFMKNKKGTQRIPKFETHKDLKRYLKRTRDGSKQAREMMLKLFKSGKKTNRYVNNINIKLLTDNDCKALTGFTWKEIYKQADMCKLTDFEIFHLRDEYIHIFHGKRIRYYSEIVRNIIEIYLGRTYRY